MTKEKKKQWLKAVKRLREYYEEYPLDSIPDPYEYRTYEKCPSCVVAGRVNRCNNCLWLEFEGAACYKKKWHIATARERLDRLDRWKKLLKKTRCSL